MPLGTRISRLSRAAVLANQAPNSREPSLLLYFSWIRNSSTSTSTSSAESLRQKESHSEPVVQQKPVSIPTHAATLSDDHVELRKRFHEAKATSSSEQQAPEIRDAPSWSCPPNITEEDGKASMQQEQSTEDNIPRTAATEKKVHTLLKFQALKENTVQAASSSKKEYQATRRVKLQSWMPDWQAVLSTLIEHTPDHGPWLSEAMKFDVPLDVAPRILFGIDDYFLEIGSKYDCQLKLGPRDEVTLAYSSFIISGSAISINKFAAEILLIAPNVKITPYKDNLSSNKIGEGLEDSDEVSDSTMHTVDNVLKIHNVITEFLPMHRVQPGFLPKPSEWTQLSFLSHVQSLVSSSVTSHVNKYGFLSTQPRKDAIADSLRELFNNPDVRPFITREACHAAMWFWVTGNHIKDARILFVYMEKLNLQLVPQTFLILLSGAAKFEDLHNFHFILNLMLHRRIEPNGPIWVQFMNCFSDPEIKLHIALSMQRKGLLNLPATMIDVASQLVSHELELSLNKGQQLATFIAHMDSRYGSRWISPVAGNKVLNILGARGLISLCWEFLHFMESRQITPRSYGLETVLHHCKQAGNIEGAVDLLLSLPKSMCFQAGEETYRIMFQIAWDLHLYNVARVVWRYACLSGATTFRMRQRVWKSMKESNSLDPRNSRMRWLKFVGPVIIGVSDVRKHPCRYQEGIMSKMKFKRHSQHVEARKENFIKKDNFDSGVPELQEYPHNDKQDSSWWNKSQDESQPMEQDSSQPHESGGNKTDSVKSSTSEQPGPESKADTQSFPLQVEGRQLPEILDPWGLSTTGNSLPAPKTATLIDIINADLEMFKEWQPTRPFPEMLAEALERDQQWKKDMKYSTRELSWFRDGRVMKVGIKTRDGVVVEWV